ncbi:MAG: electron transfer flavoprotein subunit alpha/FixB family protein, partial [Acidovorax sp.]|nr:electron transfer flavoprotein subunit alpha/FixB family protein [Acidovorax sp.]
MTTLIIAEHDNAVLKAATLNTIAAATRIGGDIHVLVAGRNCAAVAQTAAAVAGVSKVLHADAAHYEAHMAESLAELRRELTEVVGSRPLTETEIQAARANMVLGLAGNWETNAAIAGELQNMVVWGVPENYYDTYAGTVGSMTAAQAAVAAQAVVGSGPTTWVVGGDRAGLDTQYRALG